MQDWKDKKHDKKDKCHCDKHHHHQKDCKKNRADLRDFEYYVLDPNKFSEVDVEIPVGSEYKTATVILDKVKKGDVVWLNGVVGLKNDSSLGDEDRILMRIYRGPNMIPGQEIYKAKVEIDSRGDDNFVVEPFSHVDMIMDKEDNLMYTLTLEADGENSFIKGPITFTAMAIDKKY